jgi:hypothetical protein
LERYQVIKDIKKDRKRVAKVGDILIAKNDFNRLYGVKVLLKGDTYICDLGSSMANENCVKIYE